MEIFNIHIFEFLVIAGLALVVFGPERLPEVGRFIGQQVAKFLAWQQQSPELQMLNEVRSEFEREIADLRDELVRTRQQLDVSKDISAIKEDLRPMLDLKGNMQLPTVESLNGVKAPATPDTPEPTIAPPELQAPDAPAAIAPADAADAVADLAAPDAPLTVRPAAQTVPAAAQPNRIVRAEPTSVLGQPGPSVGDQQFAEAPAGPPAESSPSLPADPPEQPEFEHERENRNGAPEPERAHAALDEVEREALLRRVQAIAAELQALSAELQARGVLRPEWQLPTQPTEQETISR